jgi:uncharacterized protein YjdB
VLIPNKKLARQNGIQLASIDHWQPTLDERSTRSRMGKLEEICMLNRFCFGSILIAGFVLPFTGCSNTQVGSIQISPASQSLTVSQTVQFTATGIVGHGAHPTSSQDVTSLATWTSSTADVATVNSAGLATAVSAGTTTIMASMPGAASATATITVTGGSGGAGGTLTSLAIIPGSQSVASPSQTTQFIAIGTTSSGATEDLTGSVTWRSSSVQVATINAGGLATGVGQGTTTITAIATNANNTVVSGTATFTVISGTSEPITAISLSPISQSVAINQSGQFIALGTQGSTGLQEDVTAANNIAWSSSIPAVATIGANTGLAAAKSQGTTTITAQYRNPDNSVVTATGTLTVTALPTAPESLLSIAILPNSQTDYFLNQTSQFIAIGTFSSAPYTQDLTNAVTWSSSNIAVATINNTGSPGPNQGGLGAPAGLATLINVGTTAITAFASNPDGSVVTGVATLTCPPGQCSPVPETMATLTIYGTGNNTSTWLVVAPSATGTANMIHCGPGSQGAGLGGPVCVGTYPAGTTVTLTAPAGVGAFGGWSSNCVPTATPTEAGPNSCKVLMSDQDTVGVIFN